jgi:hypothetical protein
MRFNRAVPVFALAASVALAACDDDPVAIDVNEEELITQVTITLTPVGGGADIVTTISDPDGLGPLPPQAQTSAVALDAGTTYNGSVRFLDASDPTDIEDITLEVAREDDEHRVFYTVAGLAGVSVPLASLDVDGNGAPLGLNFQVVVDAGQAAGTGTLQVLLSHYDDGPKGDGLTPSDETDIDVTFDISVN